MAQTTYLDHPDHNWSVSEHAVDPPGFTLRGMVAELAAANSPTACDLVLRGFAGLMQRHPEASVEDCLLTSMVWYFG